MVGDPFEQVIGIRPAHQAPGEPSYQGNDVELPDGVGEGKDDWIERHADHPPSCNTLVPDAAYRAVQTHGAYQHGQVKKRGPDADVIIVQVKYIDVVEWVDGGRDVMREMEEKHDHHHPAKRSF